MKKNFFLGLLMVACLLVGTCDKAEAAEFIKLSSWNNQILDFGPWFQTETVYLIIPDDGDTLIDIAQQLEQLHNQGPVFWDQVWNENSDYLTEDVGPFEILWSDDLLEITVYSNLYRPGAGHSGGLHCTI